MTNEELQAHLKSGPARAVGDHTFRLPARRIHCTDGFVISVQASDNHRSTPQNLDGPYLEVEAGFPSEAEPDLVPYAEDVGDLTGTVYNYVPIGVILNIINKHGGVNAS